MLASGSFRLTKWISSEKNVIKHTPKTERDSPTKVVGDEIVTPTEQALGVTCNTETDCLVYQVRKRAKTDTRRKILSLIALLFDPNGLLTPFLVRAKMFLQQSLAPWCLPGWSITTRIPGRMDRVARSTRWLIWVLSASILPTRCRQASNHSTPCLRRVGKRAFCSVAYFLFVNADGAMSPTEAT